MKKYLLTSAAALAFCGLFTSCTHDFDGLTAEESVTATYEKAFITAFGQPAPDQTWGFGTSIAKAATRGTRTYDDRPTMPTFRSDSTVVGLVRPQFYNTLEEASTALGNNFYYSKDRVNNYQDGDVIYINKAYTSVPDNRDLTIYVDGPNDVVEFSGNTHQNKNGVVFVVTSYTTLKVSSLSQKVSIYLAPHAKLQLGDNSYVTFDNNWLSIDQNNKRYTDGPISLLYLSENSTVTGGNTLKFQNGARVLNDGGTIEVPNLELDDYCSLKNDGTVTISNDLTCKNQFSYIRNSKGKRINVGGDLNLINNLSYLYNDEGIVDVTGAIVLNNTYSEIVNNGTLYGGSLSGAGGGKFYNTLKGTVEIEGETLMNNSTDCWMNDGHYTTGSYTIYGQANHLYNNCYLTVEGLFNMYDSGSKFVLQGDASLVCQTFHWKTSFFYMGSRSLLKVEEELYSENDNNDGKGFHGPSGDNPYAVIQARNITKSGDNQHSMAYYGNLYVDAQNHFEQGAKDPMNGQPAQPYYYHDDAVQFSFTDTKDLRVVKTGSPVTIPHSNCSPGYNEDHEPEGDVVRVVAEDLTASTGNDFDFNDVVFDVELKENNLVYVYVRAAGGTLPLYIGEGNEAVEVHGLFGQDTNFMINTGGTDKGYGNCIDNLTPKGIFLSNPLAGQADANNVKQVAKAIKVVVIKNINGTSTPCELLAEPSQPTAKLCVGTDYWYITEGGKRYPCLTERTPIYEHFIYNSDVNSDYKGRDKFSLYVKGIFGDDWYKSTAQPKPNAQPN